MAQPFCAPQFLLDVTLIPPLTLDIPMLRISPPAAHKLASALSPPLQQGRHPHCFFLAPAFPSNRLLPLTHVSSSHQGIFRGSTAYLRLITVHLSFRHVFFRILFSRDIRNCRDVRLLTPVEN